MQVTESDAVDVAEITIKRHTSDLTTKAMAFIALLKLSSRFPSCSEYVYIYTYAYIYVGVCVCVLLENFETVYFWFLSGSVRLDK